MIRRLLIAAALTVIALSVLSTTAVELDIPSAGVILGVLTLSVPAALAGTAGVTVLGRLIGRGARTTWRQLRRARRLGA